MENIYSSGLDYNRPPKKNKKKTIIISVVAVIVLLVLAAVLALGQPQPETDSKVQQSVKPFSDEEQYSKSVELLDLFAQGDEAKAYELYVDETNRNRVPQDVFVRLIFEPVVTRANLSQCSGGAASIDTPDPIEDTDMPSTAFDCPGRDGYPEQRVTISFVSDDKDQIKYRSIVVRDASDE